MPPMTLCRAHPDIVALYPYRDGVSLIRFSDGRVERIPNSLAIVLKQLHSWRSLDGHTKYLQAADSSRQIRTILGELHSKPFGGVVERMLLSLVQSGVPLLGSAKKYHQIVSDLSDSALLVTEQVLIDSLTARELGTLRVVPPRSPITVSVPTYCRPDLLYRALRSLAREQGKNPVEVIVHVVDDARTSEDEIPVDQLALFGAEQGLTIRYSNRADRKRYAAALSVESGIDSSLIDYLVLGTYETIPDFGYRTGSARNALLIDAPNGHLVQMDDDVILDLHKAPDYQSGVSFDDVNFREYWPAQNYEAALTVGDSADISLLSVLVSGLGKHPLSLIPHNNHDLSVKGLTNELWTILSSPSASIDTSYMGIRGHNVSPYFTPLINTHSLERIMYSESSYAAFRSGSATVQTTKQHSVFANNWCVTALMASQVGDALPSLFLPSCHGEDTFFGIMGRACFPNSLQQQVPYTVMHNRAEPRTWSYDPLKQLGRAITIIGQLTHRFRASYSEIHSVTDSAEYRLWQLSEYLRSVANQPANAFRNEIAELSIKQFEHRATRFATMTQYHRDYCSAWHRDMWHVYGEKWRLPELASRDEFITDIPGSERYAALQQMLLLLSDSLEAWPAVWKASRALHEKGIRISRAV